MEIWLFVGILFIPVALVLLVMLGLLITGISLILSTLVSQRICLWILGLLAVAIWISRTDCGRGMIGVVENWGPPVCGGPQAR